MSKLANLLKEYLELRETARKLSEVEFQLRNLSQPETAEHAEAEADAAQAWLSVRLQEALILAEPVPEQLPAQLAEALLDIMANEAWRERSRAEKAYRSSPEYLSWEREQAEKAEKTGLLALDFEAGPFPGEEAFHEKAEKASWAEEARSALHSEAQAIAEYAAQLAQDEPDYRDCQDITRQHLETAWKLSPVPVPPPEWRTSPAAYRRLVKRRAAQLLGIK